jgi:hypothetical protein
MDVNGHAGDAPPEGGAAAAGEDGGGGGANARAAHLSGLIDEVWALHVDSP